MAESVRLLRCSKSPVSQRSYGDHRMRTQVKPSSQQFINLPVEDLILLKEAEKSSGIDVTKDADAAWLTQSEPHFKCEQVSSTSAYTHQERSGLPQTISKSLAIKSLAFSLILAWSLLVRSIILFSLGCAGLGLIWLIRRVLDNGSFGAWRAAIHFTRLAILVFATLTCAAVFNGEIKFIYFASLALMECHYHSALVSDESKRNFRFPSNCF